MPYYVYILASQKNGTLYIGATNDLVRRVWEHKQKAVDGFTKRYSVHHLVYVEAYGEARLTIQRERTMKHWSRAWKRALIEKTNPDLRRDYEIVCPSLSPAGLTRGSMVQAASWIAGSNPAMTEDKNGPAGQARE
jgi:putative endonuclease